MRVKRGRGRESMRELGEGEREKRERRERESMREKRE